MKNNDRGTLYIVSTPIGNMDDMTKRAVKVLEDCDVIACEDTRRTLKLMKKYNISKSLESYHDHNKEKKTPYILNLLEKGKLVALVSDSGTPCISDPGFYLVKKAIKNGYELCTVPGPSSILSALILSGLPTDRFIFEGFLPKKSGKRKDRIARLKEEERTIILFESPFRLLSLLREMQETLGERNISVSRELTKLYEETVRGTISTLIRHFEEKKPKGEFVIVLEGKRK
ncbi:16S rRNA (cytidine(1402)-2'-O)-methyltransferase [candidate division WOR-3 bacterium]|nr:16S rRNA (cytidine(1402)-2'-O)-methyltransferase [candidate division WOR-3 bacterium]MCK4574835.1 16S rRNA (cytidine(1402)-2'-O)-methyltransferase [candidate division WOR-3 bacterium]